MDEIKYENGKKVIVQKDIDGKNRTSFNSKEAEKIEKYKASIYKIMESNSMPIEKKKELIEQMIENDYKTQKIANIQEYIEIKTYMQELVANKEQSLEQIKIKDKDKINQTERKSNVNLTKEDEKLLDAIIMYRGKTQIVAPKSIEDDEEECR